MSRLYKTNKMGQAKLYVGLGNYKELLQSASFINSLKVTLIFVLIVVVGGMLLGLIAAVLCNKAFPGIRVFSTSYALPMAIASSSAAMIFQIMFHPAVGIVNKLTGLDINWLNDPNTALICVAILTAWLNSGINFLYDSGWIVPMQQMIDADSYDVSEIEPNLAAYYTIDNELYSMPFNSSTPIMYYNKDMFDKAGITEIPDSLEGIGEIGQDLLDRGGAGEVMSLGIYGWFFEQFIGKQGLEYANNGNGHKEAATAVAFDENSAAKNILTAWKDLNDKGFAPVVGKGGDAGLADFSAGKSAITLGSTASLKQILQDVNGKFEVGTAYFPKIKSSDEGGVSIGGASLWALNNNDPKKLRATWEFVKFLISPESQAYWNAQTGYFPVTVKSQEEQVFKDNVAKYPQFQTAIDQLHDSSADYVGALLSVFPEARATVESEIESMLNGKEDVDTAVKNMADSINKSIEEYNLVNE